MVSIARDPNGRKRILFCAGDGTRKTIRLGKVSLTAAVVKPKVEQLVAARITGHAPDDETSRWVAGLDSVPADKLAAVGLIAERDSAKLGVFLDAFIASRSDVKDSTATVCGHTRRNLVEHFGTDKPLRCSTLAPMPSGG